MELEGIMLTEVSHNEKDKYWMIWNIEKGNKGSLTYSNSHC